MASTKKTGSGVVITAPKNEYEAKRCLFSGTCGGCSVHIRRGQCDQVGHLCVNCRPRSCFEDQESACDVCKYEYDCIARVAIGAWMRCEVPDVADLLRLRNTEGINEETRSAVEDALASRGDRKVLEACISKSAATLYQSGATWRQRAFP